MGHSERADGSAGGSETALPHAFYIPLTITAIRFGPIGTLFVSLAAAVASGPLMPLDVGAATTQSPANWLTRGVFFVLVGQIMAYLVPHSMPSILAQVNGRRLRRDLAHAVEAGQLRLELQPIVDIRVGGIAGLEALVRWDHPIVASSVLPTSSRMPNGSAASTP